MSTQQPKVPRTQKILLGLGESVLVTNTMCTGFFLNAYLLETACLTAGDVATIQIVQGCFDLLNDPLIGMLSDNTKTRFGRRRPWMAFGTVLLPFAFFFLFSPSPFGSSESGKLFFYMASFCGCSIGVTCFNISVASLVPELTDDYDERTSLSSYRLAIGNAVGFCGLMAMSNIVTHYEGDAPQTGFKLGGLVVGIMIAVIGSITFFFIKEKPSSYWKKEDVVGRNPSFQERTSSYGQMTLSDSGRRRSSVALTGENTTFIHEIKLVFKNRAFLWLLLIWLCGPSAVFILQSSLVLYCKYVFHDAALITPIIILVQGMAFLSLPFWLHISKTRGKRMAYNIGAIGLAGFTTCLTFNSDRILGYFIAAGVGFCLIVVYLIPYSMLPDCVELDEHMTGRRREGIYVGFFGFLMKISVTLAIGGSNLLLKSTGYEAPKESCGVSVDMAADDDSGQNEATIAVIRMLVGIVPAGFFVIAALCVSQYPITKEFHANLVKEIAADKEKAERERQGDGVRGSGRML
ncbi:hypothetical protein TrST_g7013 [Triparma strigata]|uniref:MFS transporter n=1 Tax=Triparma strigata TaxID=1606541 RepID=A0A9W7C1Z8_9STRA|nr:hypothetical protein TrST_g7013 [Triparma strigata]